MSFENRFVSSDESKLTTASWGSRMQPSLLYESKAFALEVVRGQCSR